ncbi:MULTISPECIES: dihydroneopterin aldolase [Legionella]|uniref:7,8-dihydroneopterin aldolase n=1 Tax=Legionella drozanskii LLAP-1 TaxID=1212489 RepID=A0A0W0SRZ8_9GAMM|nr:MULTISPECIES: dihydroneopterin aldolase [Legionella]KTC86067.1 dihydroneopterin aldolase FolB [Legionella drozanskii LLAP-1]PJE10579.1 MAG: dihydroneopterin aldolase [Legionella sp.]
MDYLDIKGLTIATRIGVYAWEQQISQRLVLDITIPANFSACEDKIDQTIDYSTLCQLITDFVESNAFQLIETVANQVAQLIKKEFNLEQVTVSVSKPHAIKNASDVRVTVTR